MVKQSECSRSKVANTLSILLFLLITFRSSALHLGSGTDVASIRPTPDERKLNRWFTFNLREHVETFFSDNNDEMVEHIRTKDERSMDALRNKFEDSVKQLLRSYVAKDVLQDKGFNREEGRVEPLFMDCVDKNVTADVVIDAFKQNSNLPPSDVQSGYCHVARIMIFISAWKQVTYSLAAKNHKLNMDASLAAWTPFIFSVHGISQREDALRQHVDGALQTIRTALFPPAPLTGTLAELAIIVRDNLKHFVNKFLQAHSAEMEMHIQNEDRKAMSSLRVLFEKVVGEQMRRFVKECVQRYTVTDTAKLTMPLFATCLPKELTVHGVVDAFKDSSRMPANEESGCALLTNIMIYFMAWKEVTHERLAKTQDLKESFAKWTSLAFSVNRVFSEDEEKNLREIVSHAMSTLRHEEKAGTTTYLCDSQPRWFWLEVACRLQNSLEKGHFVFTRENTE